MTPLPTHINTTTPTPWAITDSIVLVQSIHKELSTSLASLQPPFNIPEDAWKRITEAYRNLLVAKNLTDSPSRDVLVWLIRW